MRNLSNKRKKILIFSGVLLVGIITFVVAFGRYIFDFTKNYYLETKGFYFTSYTMSSLGSSHSFNNWDGVNTYTITIDVSSKKNEHVKTESDVAYDIEVECSSNVSCDVSKTSGIIYQTTNVDSYTITVTPISIHGSRDIAVIKTKATSTSPYVKELSTVYNLGIETFSYNTAIIDSVGSKILQLELNNAFTYYKVEEAFDDYNVGDPVGLEAYEALSPDKKAKCMSAIVTLSFDNNLIRLDMTDQTFIDKATDIRTVTIDGYTYISGFTFKMDANTTTRLIFYKLDITQDYSDRNELFDLDVVTVD